jgi:hypothetical protein
MGPTTAVVLAILLKPCQILAVALIYCPAIQRTTPHPKHFSPGLAIAVDLLVNRRAYRTAVVRLPRDAGLVALTCALCDVVTNDGNVLV